jgi:hypothetical protein
MDHPMTLRICCKMRGYLPCSPGSARCKIHFATDPEFQYLAWLRKRGRADITAIPACGGDLTLVDVTDANRWRAPPEHLCT